jgi:hypothetical protein
MMQTKIYEPKTDAEPGNLPPLELNWWRNPQSPRSPTLPMPNNVTSPRRALTPLCFPSLLPQFGKHLHVPVLKSQSPRLLQYAFSVVPSVLSADEPMPAPSQASSIEPDPLRPLPFVLSRNSDTSIFSAGKFPCTVSNRSTIIPSSLRAVWQKRFSAGVRADNLSKKERVTGEPTIDISASWALGKVMSKGNGGVFFCRNSTVKVPPSAVQRSSCVSTSSS